MATAPKPRKTPPAPVFFQLKDDHAQGPGDATSLGFWIYLMSDALLFAAIFGLMLC